MREEKPIDHSIARFNVLTTLLSLINTREEDDTDLVIARYFIEHLNEITHTSIYKIADECYVSRSSVQRFIKKLGYDSYTQMKNGLDEIIEHEKGFINYTDHTDYRNYLDLAIESMSKDIIDTSKSPSFKKLVNIFENAETIVILTAEDSSHACKLFQQQLLSMGKLIRIITSASNNISLLNTLTEKDLLMVCSVTGNYALAIRDHLDDIKAKKILLTINRTTAFEGKYSFIYYLSSQVLLSSYTIQGVRNVYNNYALVVFFDILFHDYYVDMQGKKKSPLP